MNSRRYLAFGRNLFRKHSRNSVSPVKKIFTYSEKSEEKRQEYLIRIAQIPKENRVYVDECGIKEHLQREYERTPCGVKVEDVKHGRKFHRVNVVAAVIHGNSSTGRIAPMCYQKSMTAERFEYWFENNLLKCAGLTGKTIIMDNARFHRKKYLQEACGKAGVSLIFLLPYSPDFNPIEKDWANMKRELRDSLPLDNLLEAAIYKYWTCSGTCFLRKLLVPSQSLRFLALGPRNMRFLVEFVWKPKFPNNSISITRIRQRQAIRGRSSAQGIEAEILFLRREASTNKDWSGKPGPFTRERG